MKRTPGKASPTPRSVTCRSNPPSFDHTANAPGWNSSRGRLRLTGWRTIGPPCPMKPFAQVHHGSAKVTVSQSTCRSHGRSCSVRHHGRSPPYQSNSYRPSRYGVVPTMRRGTRSLSLILRRLPHAAICVKVPRLDVSAAIQALLGQARHMSPPSRQGRGTGALQPDPVPAGSRCDGDLGAPDAAARDVPARTGG